MIVMILGMCFIICLMSFFQEAREKSISRYSFVRPNTFKMDQLFTLSSYAKLIKFVKEILNILKL